jgi:hypothetical protein
MFEVRNTATGVEDFQLPVEVGAFNGLTYLDYISPTVEGNYTFNADYPDGNPISFKVSNNAKSTVPGTTNWLLIGGVVALAGAGVAVVTLIGDRKKK